MIKRFKQHIESQFNGLKQTSVLLAISGGLDSVVLAYLLKACDVDFEMAHCNFKLRGSESDADAVFVEKLAEALQVKLYLQSFNTEAYAKDQKVSIQMAARELRYHWFEELCQKNGLAYIATAHHAKDDLETFLINLSRGSGIDGLTGITAHNEQLIRPLLPFSREEILAYAEANEIRWREDSSNASDKYLRNHLRHHAIPAIEEAAPQFLNQFQKSQQHLKEVALLLEDYTAMLFSQIVNQSFKGYELNIQKLKQTPNTKAVLYQLLKDFEFTAWDDIYDLLDAEPGKYVSAKNHRLIKDREVLLLTEHKKTHEVVLWNEQDASLVLDNLKIKKEAVDQFSKTTATEAIFDKDQLDFPLKLRKWEEGDWFYPFGLKGKKKLSKFFKDLKYSTLDKESVWLLCNDQDIIWVVGARTDDRYKVTPNTSQFLKITAYYD